MTSARGRIRVRILDALSIHETLTRMAHQILDRNPNHQQIALLGIGERGELLAKRLATILWSVEGKSVSTFNSENTSQTGLKTVILVDDLISSGRAAHRAIGSLMNDESIKCIQLAVLVDPGNHRLPIYAEYVGKNVPTATDEFVEVRLKEFDNEEVVVIVEK